MKFIEQVVQDILKIPDFYKDVFLFPTKRSVLFFEHSIKQQIENPALFPFAKSLRDYVFELTGLNKLDAFNLTFEFFEVYKSIFPNETFENFFMWSQILLKDFEEIDFSNTSAEKILVNIAELKKIDAYVESFDKENPSEYRNKFFYFWDNLLLLYKNFNTHLIKKRNSSYYGYALKYLIQLIKKNKISIKGRNLYFIGFSDLQFLELELIKLVMEKGKAKFYFDVDEIFFTKNFNKSEIYQLFEKIEKKISISVPKQKYIGLNPLEITLVPCKNSIQQFKICNYVLKNIIQKYKDPLENYAIILNEPNSLDVVLNSLPKELEAVNITVGLPLEKTHIAKLIVALFELKIYPLTIILQNKLSFILHNPYFQYCLNEEDKINIEKWFNFSYITHENLNEIPFFRNWIAQNSIASSITFLLDWIFSDNQCNTVNSLEVIRHEEFYSMYLFLTKIKNNLNKLPTNLDLKNFLLILKQLLQTEFIPFSGEPLKGLQIMELQESQSLDFKYVFLMNVNEGILPKSPDYSSFIPMELKKANHLRTPEDLDARYAYLFYRLFHRAKHIFLFYNQTEQEEESRFVKQTKILFKTLDKITINEKNFSLSPKKKYEIKPIIITKNPNIMQKILQTLTHGISPTNLINYLYCPLKFYYLKIEEIQSEEEYEDNLKSNEFGNIAHNILEKIYKSLNNNKIKTIPFFEIHSKNLKEWLEKYSNILPEWISDEFKKNYPHKKNESKNYFLLKAIEHIILKIIDKDIERLHNRKITIYGLEEKLEKTIVINGVKIRMHGKIDRIEKENKSFFVLDYKSSKIGKTEIENLKVFDSENIAKYKEAFQLFFYSMLLDHQIKIKNRSNNHDIYAGIYSFRKLNDGWIALQNNNDLLNYKKFEKEFEEFITSKIIEILDPNVPFVQTSYEANCKYCPFLKNCGKFHLIQQ